MGTSVGSKVFLRYGWRAAAALSVAWYGFQFFVLVLRGPHCERYTWFGYQGGAEWRKSVVDEKKKAAASGGDAHAPTDIEAGRHKDEKMEAMPKGKGDETNRSPDVEHDSKEPLSPS